MREEGIERRKKGGVEGEFKGLKVKLIFGNLGFKWRAIINQMQRKQRCKKK